MGTNHDLLRRFVTTADAAKLADVTVASIYKWAASGRIEAYRVGTCILYLRADIERIIAEREAKRGA